MQYQITLTAGVEKRQEFTGQTLVILDTGAATSIDMKVEIAGYAVEELRGVKRGLKMQTPGFTGAKFTASVDCTIEVIVSAANISVNYQEGSTVNANILGTVPVSNDLGSLAAPLHVVGVTYSDAPATARNDNAATAAGPVAVQLLAANANRKEIRIMNVSGDEIAIGGAGITWAKRVIVLAAGDSFFDDKAAALAVYAITDAAKAASVTTQEVLA